MEIEISEHFDILTEVYWNVCAVECYYGISVVCKDMTLPKLSSEELIIVNGWNLLLGQAAVENNSFSFYHEKGPKNRGISLLLIFLVFNS